MKKLIGLSVSLFLFSLASLGPAVAQDQPHKDKERKKERAAEKAASLPEAIWNDPGDVSKLNLYYGAGGKEHAPDGNGKFKFVKEDMEGTSPKFDVDDEQGVHWRAKLGEEPQSETAATRLLWAAGYFVDEDYYLPEIKVEGIPKLKRGWKFVSSDGTVHRVRLERREKEDKKLDIWDWYRNPFEGTRELNGLKIMMALVNNWDLKSANNQIKNRDGKREFLVSDVGASFGKTGNSFTRSKSDPTGYIASKFIQKETPESVDFVMHSRPFFLSIFNIPNYETRTRMESITKHIPTSDAKWLGQRLSLLSDNQIRDSFVAAGYTPEEIDEYTAKVRERISDLNDLRTTVLAGKR